MKTVIQRWLEINNNSERATIKNLNSVRSIIQRIWIQTSVFIWI